MGSLEEEEEEEEEDRGPSLTLLYILQDLGSYI